MQDGFVDFGANLFTVSFEPYGKAVRATRLRGRNTVLDAGRREDVFRAMEYRVQYRSINAQKCGGALQNRVYNRGCTPVCAVQQVIQ